MVFLHFRSITRETDETRFEINHHLEKIIPKTMSLWPNQKYELVAWLL